MRIAINGLSARGGGGVTFLKNLLRHLLAIDRENEYLVLVMEEKAEALGIRDHYPNLRTLIYPSRGWVVRGMWEQLVMPWILQKENIDVLYAVGNQGPIFYGFPLVILLQAVNPLVRDFEASSLTVRMKMLLMYFLMRASGSRAQKIVVVSEYTRRLLIEKLKCDPRKIVVIPHGAPADAGLTPEEEAVIHFKEYKIERPYLLAVSDIRNYKNYGALLEAFAIASKSLVESVDLVIAGAVVHEELMPRLRRLVRNQGLDHRVHFVGSVEPRILRVFYDRSLGMVFPSRLESFGLPLLEAMSYGVPVAASRIEPAVEVCGDAVLYFDPVSPQEIANAMLDLCHNDDLRKNLVERGRVRAKQFSWETTARQTLKVLEVAASAGIF